MKRYCLDASLYLNYCSQILLTMLAFDTQINSETECVCVYKMIYYISVLSATITLILNGLERNHVTYDVPLYFVLGIYISLIQANCCDDIECYVIVAAGCFSV